MFDNISPGTLGQRLVTRDAVNYGDDFARAEAVKAERSKRRIVQSKAD